MLGLTASASNESKETSSPFGREGHDRVSTQPSTEEEVSLGTITLGVDLAKRVFSVCEMDAAGHVLRRQELKRDAFAAWLAQQPAGTIVAMEACSRAHRWAQRRLEHRLQPSLRRRGSERFRSREAFDPQRPLLSNAIPRGSDRSWSVCVTHDCLSERPQIS